MINSQKIMKRRHFMQAIAAVPASSSLLAQQPPVVRGRQAPDAQPLPVLDATISDTAAEPTHRFFSEEQFAALRKLSDTLLPPMDGYPGAIAAGAPEFLDFLVGVHPEKQELYRTGLDSLNLQAKAKYHRSFTELDSSQADTILQPLFKAGSRNSPVPERFIREAHQDIRTATVNSREWAQEASKAGRRGGSGMYWLPVDPTFR
jgi:hypothetical protein